MNYNLLAYSIYLPLISFIMLKVGWIIYKHGEVFLLNLFDNNKTLVTSINNILLIGYYLTNIGYAIITISLWDNLTNYIELINSLTLTSGRIILLLALLHYNNIFWLKYIHKINILNQ